MSWPDLLDGWKRAKVNGLVDANSDLKTDPGTQVPRYCAPSKQTELHLELNIPGIWTGAFPSYVKDPFLHSHPAFVFCT